MRLFALIILLASFPAAAEMPKIKDDACKAMILHEPSPDVEYKPGVDVNGRPVVEADISPSVITVPDKIEFDITADVAKYAGITVPSGFENQARIGTVTIDKSGHMTFNGRPVEGEAEAALRQLCREKPALQKDKNIIYNP